MPLPLCVKVEANDVVSREALEIEGWRFIGQLNTYSGKVYEERVDDRVFYCPDPGKQGVVNSIEWTGRLWRDKAVKTEDASAAMAWLLADESLTCYAIGKGPAAFGLFRNGRVVLIGVHPMARSLGLATALIRRIARGTGKVITAGTYSDNTAAIALYRSLDMDLILSQAVFHK
jgi:ribosomal protein S18 acetylase RimI-like enzyme